MPAAAATQELEGRAEKNTYKPLSLCLNQTARHTHAHTQTHTRSFRVYPCQVEHCGVAGGASGVLQPNVSSSINGFFSRPEGENTLKNHTSERPSPPPRLGTNWLTFSKALLNTPLPSNTERTHAHSHWQPALSLCCVIVQRRHRRRLQQMVYLRRLSKLQVCRRAGSFSFFCFFFFPRPALFFWKLDLAVKHINQMGFGDFTSISFLVPAAISGLWKSSSA